MFFSCFPIVNVNNICALKFVDDETEKNKRDNEKMHCGNECKRKKMQTKMFFYKEDPCLAIKKSDGALRKLQVMFKTLSNHLRSLLVVVTIKVC